MTSRAPRRFAARLRLLAVIAAGVGVLLAVLATIALDLAEIRRETVSLVSSLAEVVAVGSAAPLAFGDAEAATETLSAFAAVPGVARAALWSEDGAELATYAGRAAEAAPPLALTPPGHRFARGYLHLAKEVAQGGEVLGTVAVLYDTRRHEARLWQKVAVTVVLGALAVLVAALVAGRIARVLARPVDELARVARKISETQRYDTRARRLSDDELGELTATFNHMLGQIQRQNEELEMARSDLEARVRERTRELEHARQRAEAASRAKSAFLASMSHEIRTPMTAILGYADLLGDASATPEQRATFLETITRNANFLLAIINDILDFSKIEAGRMTVERVACSPLHLVGDTASVMGARAAEKGLSFEVEVEGALPESVRTDPTRVRQVLMNLLSNAVKFTERGGITLRVRLVEDAGAGGGGSALVFEVADTGLGMGPGQLEGLFQPFTQADQTMTRRFGGTGLGLAISKNLVELLGGAIEVESRAGEGSCFRVTVPVEVPGGTRMVTDPSLVLHRSIPAAEPPPALDAHVLLAEDGVDNRRLLETVLRQAGARVASVVNGQQAVDRALEAEAEGDPFDVVLMDMQMPVLDGYTATRRLRQAGYPRPIVALTAHATTTDRARCLAAGCDDYASKPVRREVLLQQLADVLEDRDGRVAGGEPPAEAPAEADGAREAHGGVPAGAGAGDGPLVSSLAVEPGYGELLAMFAEAMPGYAATLRRAGEAGDRATLADVAHQLKGAGGMYGYDAVTDAAARLERAAKDGAADPALGAAVRALVRTCERVAAGAARGPG